jgi:hypothetical protein
VNTQAYIRNQKQLMTKGNTMAKDTKKTKTEYKCKIGLLREGDKMYTIGQTVPLTDERAKIRLADGTVESVTIEVPDAEAVS